MAGFRISSPQKRVSVGVEGGRGDLALSTVNLGLSILIQLAAFLDSSLSYPFLFHFLFLGGKFISLFWFIFSFSQ